MPLGPEQREKAQRFFRFNGVVADCPYCGTRGWEAGEIVSSTVVISRNVRAEGTNVAMVQFVCDNCGHVTLFDAERLGLFDA